MQGVWPVRRMLLCNVQMLCEWLTQLRLRVWMDDGVGVEYVERVDHMCGDVI
jgi:hypothetical protein